MYTTSNQSCRLAVQAFLRGWVETLHPNFKAGIYGFSVAAQLDFSKVNADDVMITQVLPPNQVTIWGLGQLCDPFSKNTCTLWAKNQRIHQYQINVKNQSYGNVLFKQIDKDVVDADIAGTNKQGAKQYIFDSTSFTPIECNGATALFLEGINNVGQIVGDYYDSNDVEHNFVLSPPYNGDCVLIPNYQGLRTFVSSINNAGLVVGGYFNSSGVPSGFLYDTKKQVFTQTFSCSGATGGVQPAGLNDDGQVVGAYYYTNGNELGFLYNSLGNKSCTTVQYPMGGGDTYVYGTNGDTVMAGNYGSQSVSLSFIYNAALGSNGFSKLDIPDASASGINNNAEVVGSYYKSKNEEHGFLYEYQSKSLINLDYPCTNAQTEPVAINDKAEVIGFANCSTGTVSFIASPKP